MAYSDFTNRELKKKFGIVQKFETGLFAAVPKREVGVWLSDFMADNLIFALEQGTEKARSEFILAPIFVELRKQAEKKISIFSGVEFNVDKELGLSGRCDFLISRSPYQVDLEVPVVVAVEAKQEDFDGGITQCAAEMTAARIFNEREGLNLREMYGCVTTGDIWRFLILRENELLVDENALVVPQDIDRIFGILWAMTFDEVPSAKK